jgi:signal transduction histidine kinase
VQDILPYVIVLGAFLLAASAFQLSLGLRPLSRVSSDLKLIEEAPGKRLDGEYPREISELISAVNSLLDAKEKTIAKSRSRAADLAHGLKTPLTVLANNADKLRKAGNADMAGEIASLCSVMQNHIDHELTRSRIAEASSLGIAKAEFTSVMDEIQRTLAKTPKGENLNWKREGDMAFTVRIDPHDLRELIGNIVENAVKWTSGTIMIKAKKTDGFLQVSIEDDGPGVASDKIDQMTTRGKRFDETISGTGFGLSIVQDIVENYKLPFSIQNRQTSGLLVTVGLPIAEKSKRQV